MTVQTITVSQKACGCQHCPCGCAPCEENCCSLDCIVQPRFFCGQLLTDQDLSTLVNWTKDRLRLSRYTDGWGVACGLQVICDPDNCSGVIVRPGYAIGCCGDDIVVCEDKHFDLSEACAEEKDPCADLNRSQVAGVAAHTLVTNESELLSGLAAHVASAQLEKEREVRYVDLYINYNEELFNSQTALGRSVCKQVAECEYSRIREGATLRWKPTTSTSDPNKAAVVAWKEGFDKCLEVIDQFQREFPDVASGKVPDDQATLAQTAADVRRWLLRWIDEHPLQQFCILKDEICRASDANLLGPALSRLLFLLVQECHIRYVSCECHCCEEGHGVLLARIALRRVTDERGKACCQVYFIDSYPPYRRNLSKDCWPAPLACFNAGQLIWHRYEEACTALSSAGARVSHERQQYLDQLKSRYISVGAMKEYLEVVSRDPFICCGDSVVVHTVNFAGIGERVIGFTKGTASSQGNSGVSVGKLANRRWAKPGERVTFVARVANQGDTSLIVEVEDDRVEIPDNVARLDPGAVREFPYVYTVAENDPEDLLTEVKVVATTPSGETLIETASTNVSIPRGDTPDPVEITDKDSFQEINDIAAEREAALYRNGIVTYEALAITPVEELEEMLPNAGRTVARQAKLQAARLAMQKNIENQ